MLNGSSQDLHRPYAGARNLVSSSAVLDDTLLWRTMLATTRACASTIRNHAGERVLATAPVDRLTGITLGLRMPEPHRTKLIELAKVRPEPPESWQAGIHETKYQDGPVLAALCPRSPGSRDHGASVSQDSCALSAQGQFQPRVRRGWRKGSRLRGRRMGARGLNTLADLGDLQVICRGTVPGTKNRADHE